MEKIVKLIALLLWIDDSKKEKAIELLTEEFSKIDFIGEIRDFNLTDYYVKEMGSGVQKRMLISFKEPVNGDRVSEIKNISIKIEKELSVSGGRTVNIDTGYIDFYKLVLFSVKEQSMKLYFGKGIYADIVMEYSKRNWKKFPWTFADFKDNTYDEECTRIRDLFKINMKTNH